MKKRIISIALVAVMIVAMIPAMLLPTAAIYFYDGYDGALVANDAIDVDASVTPDAAYLTGEKITNLPSRTYIKEEGQTSSFESYIAADENGFYVWFSVVDQSLDKGDGYKVTEEVADPDTGDVTKTEVTKIVPANGGDRFELYVRADGNNRDARVAGILDFDYLGQLANTTKYGTIDTSKFDYAYATTETGWVGETYIPWNALADGFTTTEAITSFQIAIQCNNMTNDNKSTHRAYCYDNTNASSAYRGMYGGHTWSSGDNNTGWQGSHLIPVNFVGIKTAVVANALTVDGVMDDAYTKSEKITPDVTKEGINYDAYTVATVDGLYIFADIKDATLNKDDATAVGQNDKFQVYFQMGAPNSNANWGYVEMDYTATNNFGYTNKGSAWYGGAPDASKMLHAFTTNEKGWTAEIFIPWAGDIAMDGLNDLSKQAVSIVLQAGDATTGATAYSNRWGDRAWYANNGGSGGPSGNFWFAPLTFVFDEDVTPTVNNFAVYADSITLDGVKDDKYSDLASELVDTVWVTEDRILGKNYGWHYGDVVLAKVYYAFTDTDAYVFVEVYDDTVPKSDYSMEYVSIYSTNGVSAGKFNLRANGEQGNPGTYEGSSLPYVLYDGTNADKATLALTHVGTKEAYTGYNVEYRMPLSESDKAALAAGKPIYVGIGVEINDSAYLPDYLADKTADGRLCYGYNEGSGGSWWVSGIGKGYMSMPEIRLDKDFAFDADITSANVALGSSIAVNYYAQIPHGDPAYYEMKFDFNGETTYAKAVKTAVPGEYKFTFDGIAPQCMGDNLAATLLYNGVEVDAVAEYSVMKNCMNLIAAEKLNEKQIQLVADLGAYGAAAQKYVSYKTNTLVNKGFEEYATVVTEIDNNDRTIEGKVTGATISAAGVFFDSTNRIFVKVKVTDATVADALSLTINGTAVKTEATDVENVVIAYTDDLLVTEFDDVFTFVLTYAPEAAEGEEPVVETQTVTYSVNAYCKAKLNAANPATAALAAATYAYGASAEACIA